MYKENKKGHPKLISRMFKSLPAAVGTWDITASCERISGLLLGSGGRSSWEFFNL